MLNNNENNLQSQLPKFEKRFYIKLLALVKLSLHDLNSCLLNFNSLDNILPLIWYCQNYVKFHYW